jgi:gliding motility-associated-like protein
MRNLLLTISAALLYQVGYSQLTLERQVIAPFFLVTDNADTLLLSTGGQVAHQTLSTPNSYLTQGFQQPSGLIPITVQISATFNTCDGTFNVTIDQISGCAHVSEALIMWNNDTASIYTEGLPSLSTLHITTGGGCQLTQAFIFSLLEYESIPCDLTFYHFISPNNDFQNDTWIIENIDADVYSVNQVSIYNRWGNEVWSASGYNNREVVWSGESKDSEPLPDGTYFYEANIAGTLYKGYIELKR